jgi:hypothetical protein
MRRSQRLIASAVLISLSGALAGCSSGLTSWDPSDLLDFLDTKKKLAGDRKPVFPEGVPGLEQGVPKELYKGAQQQPDQPNAQAAAPEEPKSKSAKSKGKSKQPATASTAPAPDAETAPAEEGGAAAMPAEPKPKKIARRRTTAPPPDQTAAQPDQPAPSAQPAQPSQQSAAPFPAPMPSGTFTR